MTTAAAVGVLRPGGPDALGVIEREVREPGAGEVRIAVRAAAVNPTDVGLRERGVEGVPPPWTPGMDAAGVVESVGAGVERVAVGEEVMAAVLPRRPEGGAQVALIVVPEASVTRAPAGVTPEQAATLPMNGLTALVALEQLDLREGETLLVTGGAGLLASYAIPLARRRGLRVLADAKPEDEALVHGFGADVVLPRGDGLLDAIRAVAPAGVDGVLDTALLRREIFPAIRPGGGIAVVRSWDTDDESEQGIRIHRVQVARVLQRSDWLDELRDLAEVGALALRVASTHSPEGAADAHRLLEAGGVRGRPVIVFPPS